MGFPAAFPRQRIAPAEWAWRLPRCVRNGPGVSWTNSLSKATRRNKGGQYDAGR